ncbi:MAG: DUF1028 domain-containing protein [Verrucomicrobiaceae bacterium]|nr:DUF1028 domain-containing protein [Verrucomicrobiaceae bacterium]
MRTVRHFLVTASFVIAGCASPREPSNIVATYSIVAFDPATGDLGVAVQSKFFGVGSVVPFAKANVGAVATQASANVTYGPRALRLLEEGKSPEEIVQELPADDERRDYRQFGVIDAKGRPAARTGDECLAFAGHRTGRNFSVQGNILAGKEVLDAMAVAFESAQKLEGGELADWLVAALQAGEDAGGDRRGRQSAALLVARDGAGYGGASDRYIDLRVEDHPDPTHELARLLGIHKSFYADAHRNRPAQKQSRLEKRR